MSPHLKRNSIHAQSSMLPIYNGILITMWTEFTLAFDLSTQLPIKLQYMYLENIYVLHMYR